MARTAKAHERRVQRTYGLEPGQYEAMLASQGGRCAICGNRPVKRRLAVDHDHITNRVRGLLCMRCNRALGMWELDIDKLKRLRVYIGRIILDLSRLQDSQSRGTIQGNDTAQQEV